MMNTIIKDSDVIKYCIKNDINDNQFLNLVKFSYSNS